MSKSASQTNLGIGPNSAKTPWTITNNATVGRIALAQNDFVTAAKYYREALAGARLFLTNGDPLMDLCWRDLAEALSRQNKFAETEAIYREMILTRRAYLAATNEDLIAPTASLGRTLTDWVWTEHTNASGKGSNHVQLLGRAREAERLLRDCLPEISRDGAASNFRLQERHTRLAFATAVVTFLDPALNQQERQQRLTEAQRVLVACNENVQRNRNADRKYKRDVLTRLVRFYEGWESLVPGAGHAVKAAERRQQLDAFDKAAEAGNASGQAFPPGMYLDGKVVPKDEAEFVLWVRKSAEQGNPAGQDMLGQIYDKGRGIERDVQEAVRLFRLSAEQGDKHGQYHLGVMYANGRGVTTNESEAVRWYRKAADQGHASAQNDLGFMYVSGQGVKNDDSEAVRWFRAAAQQNHSEAQMYFGWMYANGRGVKKDESEAARWYLKAAEQKNARAANYLGWLYAQGRGVDKDLVEANRWWRKAAEQGEAEAQHRVGTAYALGEGVTRDDAEAMRWYSFAAEQNYIEAQKALGWMYSSGRGVVTNDTLAARWYRKAAEQGSTSSQGYLGRLYAHGRGVPKNVTEAMQWYRRAAEKGNADSQNGLAWLLATSPKDELRNGKEAVLWATRACEGNKFKDHYFVGTLAAAYAETGDFKTALKHCETARQLAEQGKPDDDKKKFLQNLQERQELYRQGKPYRNTE